MNEPYCLKISRNNGYILFKYNQIKSDFSIPIVREARGIIFREKDWKCVCRSFDKFGNYGESYCPDIDWSTASVQEKIDGSLIRLWWDNGWWVSTNGVINAFDAQTGDIKGLSFGAFFIKGVRRVINEHKLLKCLDEDVTYFFELVSPYTRVVIPYNETEVYFLGARNMVTMEEIKPEDSSLFSLFKTPKRYSMGSVEEVLNCAEGLPWNEEGYVVCDGNFNRVKIKSPKYVIAHYARNNNIITKERLIDVILCGEKEEFLIYAPEYKDNLVNIEKKMSALEKEAKSYRNFCLAKEPSSRKDYADLVFAHTNSTVRAFCFALDSSWEDWVKDWSAAKWSKYI